MTNEELIRQLNTASIQCDEMRLRDFGYLFKTASEAIERLIAYNEFWEKAAITAKDIIVKELPKWIPVTERLPDKDDDVLIFYERVGLSGTKYREIDLMPFSEIPVEYKPLYWMTLPKPPKEVDT